MSIYKNDDPQYLKIAIDSIIIDQTLKPAEVVIVGDGPVPESLTNAVRTETARGKEEGIEVRFLPQDHNRGLGEALRIACENCRYDYIARMDSDDWLPVNSLQLVAEQASQIADNQLFCGVAANRCYPDGHKIGSSLNFDILNTDSVSFREKFHYKGDMAEVFKTDILRLYPFPEFEGEKFLTEAVVWNRIAKKYKLRYFNANIYICDYLPEGLSKNIRRHHRNSPLGTMLYYSSLTKDKRYGLKRHILDAISYWRYTWNYKGKRILPPFWVWLFFPIGVLVYIRDIRQENKL